MQKNHAVTPRVSFPIRCNNLRALARQLQAQPLRRQHALDGAIANGTAQGFFTLEIPECARHLIAHQDVVDFLF